MKRLALIATIVLLAACGTRTPSKKPSDSSNGTSGPDNASTNNSANGSANNASNNASNNAGSNGTSGPQNTATNSGTTGPACEILTSESDADYCNLQATCGSGTLLVECILDGSWLCYCGMESVELEENPCGDPDTFAPRLAESCPVSE